MMRHKLATLCLVLLLAFAMPLSAAAIDLDDSRLGSVSVALQDSYKKTPVAGVELALYHVATVGVSGERLVYAYTDGFTHCGVALDDPTLTTVLEGYVETASVAGRKTVTDGQGKAVFSDLPLGLYFVKQTNVVAGFSACKSFLVTIPYADGGSCVYDVSATPKTEIVRVADITVKKVWNTDKSTKITDEVTVQLLRDGTVVETAVLNKQNGWETTFEDMPESDGYSVKEVNIPKGFTATYSQKGYEFTVTNSAALIQTGQLVWPIPVLAMAGVLLIALGTAILRRAEDANG